MTESSPVTTMTSTDDPLEKRVSTVGRCQPNMECKIIDPETGKEVPPNTQGEFVTRGYQVMKGYYKMPEATAQAIDKEGGSTPETSLWWMRRAISRLREGLRI
jgi:fatty-acyl-CoA synthase